MFNQLGHFKEDRALQHWKEEKMLYIVVFNGIDNLEEFVFFAMIFRKKTRYFQSECSGVNNSSQKYHSGCFQIEIKGSLYVHKKSLLVSRTSFDIKIRRLLISKAFQELEHEE